MKNKESVNKNQTEKTKLPPNSSAKTFDRDKNLTYWPKDESVDPPEHKAHKEHKVQDSVSAKKGQD